MLLEHNICNAADFTSLKQVQFCLQLRAWASSWRNLQTSASEGHPQDIFDRQHHSDGPERGQRAGESNCKKCAQTGLFLFIFVLFT